MGKKWKNRIPNQRGKTHRLGANPIKGQGKTRNIQSSLIVIYEGDDKDDPLWDALSYPNIPARRYRWR